MVIRRWLVRETIVFLVGGVILLILMAALGCGAVRVRQPVWAGLTTEQIARGVYEKLTTFLQEAQSNHPECSADQPDAGKGICPALHGAIAIQNKLGHTINLYCSGVPQAGEKPYTDKGPCAPILGAEATLEGVLAEALNILPLVRNLK